MCSEEIAKPKNVFAAATASMSFSQDVILGRLLIIIIIMMMTMKATTPINKLQHWFPLVIWDPPWSRWYQIQNSTLLESCSRLGGKYETLTLKTTGCSSSLLSRHGGCQSINECLMLFHSFLWRRSMPMQPWIRNFLTVRRV